MPKASRTKVVKRHGAAVPTASKRAFALPDNQVKETVLPGSNLNASVGGSNYPENLADEEPKVSDRPPIAVKSKKIKPPASSLVPHLPLHPYSRSHIKREKKKAKEQLTGGELHSIAVGLSEALGEVEEEEKPIRIKTAEERRREKEEEQRRKEEAGKIGQGGKRTLSEKKRREQIKTQGKRIPIIMKHPAFKTNPWETIRLHASNSIAFKEKPSVEETKKGAMDIE
ncbi:hypothetical protein P7C73_g3096, partial [Tremellales sp. Uapishka_1]